MLALLSTGAAGSSHPCEDSVIAALCAPSVTPATAAANNDGAPQAAVNRYAAWHLGGDVKSQLSGAACVPRQVACLWRFVRLRLELHILAWRACCQADWMTRPMRWLYHGCGRSFLGKKSAFCCSQLRVSKPTLEPCCFLNVLVVVCS